MSTVERRAFIAAAAAAAGFASSPSRARAASRGAGPTQEAQDRPPAAVRLGAPIFTSSVAGADPDAIARAHRDKGYRAGYCPDIRLDDADRIRDTVAAFARHDVVIAEVGRWVNLLDPDAEKRKKNLAHVTNGLALAEAVGARCCVDIAGSFSPTSWFGPHPENLSERFFEAAVENARAILDAVKPTRTTFCYEMMAWSLPDSPDACLRMVRAVDRKAFAVHLDPCNLVNSPARYYGSSELVRECYRKLGPLVASAHAKDLAWEVEMAVHFREVRIGQGSIDYGVLLAEHARHAPQAPLMLEHLPNEAEYDAARDAVKAAGRRAGVAFE